MSGGPVPIEAVIFDLGGVVLRWDPRLAYREVLPEDEIDAFLDEISFPEWNQAHDAGRPWADGEQELITRLPHRAEAIRAYRTHFARAIPGMVPGTNAVIAALQQRGIGLVALTNWAADTFAQTRGRFDVLTRFGDIVVSGEEKLAKPDPAIFRLLLERNRLDPSRTLFVDDSPVNCRAAAALGLRVIRFEGAEALRAALVELGVLGEPEPVAGPIFHLTEREVWARAVRAGDYPWSTRGVGFEQQGYVHCSFSDQVSGVRARHYADLRTEDLVVLELAPERLTDLVLVEDLGAGPFLHVFRPLAPPDALAVHLGSAFDAGRSSR